MGSVNDIWGHGEKQVSDCTVSFIGVDPQGIGVEQLLEDKEKELLEDKEKGNFQNANDVEMMPLVLVILEEGRK